MKKMIAIFLCCTLALLSACGGDGAGDSGETSDPPSSPPVESTPAPSQEVMGGAEPEPSETAPAEPVNPLTGLPMAEEQAAARPVAVMLNNLDAALPQQGNGQADIIYETVTEGGITRMLAVYQSLEGVGIVGSVRSARTCFVEIALGHDAVYVHAGGSDGAYAAINSWDVDNMDGVHGPFSYSGLFWRDQARVAGRWYALEHSLVTSGEKLLSNLEESGFRLTHDDGYVCGMTFAEDGTPAGGETANTVTVPFSAYKTGVFRYDAESGTYSVEQYGGTYIDGNSGEQVAVTNVLILETGISDTGDSYGHTDVDLTEGEGWFACGGRIIPILWEKGERTSQFSYFTADGAPLTLGMGKSYVNIVGEGAEIAFE